MVTIGLITSRATSLKVVAKDLERFFQSRGYDTFFHDWQMMWTDAMKNFDKAIIVMTFSPIGGGPWFLMCRDYNIHKLPTVLYATIEGEPNKRHIYDWVRRDCPVVANSRFTYKMLKRGDIEPLGYIYHGINYEDIEFAKQDIQFTKEHLKKKLGVKVLCGTISNPHRRKGLEELARAIQVVNKKSKDIGFYILTQKEGIGYFNGLEKVIVEDKLGMLAREEILALIGSFDFYVCPSLSEGFGLPVLEAQAMGVPVIHAKYEPLIEISNLDANFTFDYIDVVPYEYYDGIIYTLHMYDPIELGKKILEASQIYMENQEEYQKHSQAVKEFAKKFDIMNVYKDFLQLLELENVQQKA